MTAASRAADALNSDDFNLPPSYNDRLPSYHEIVDTHGISHDENMDNPPRINKNEKEHQLIHSCRASLTDLVAFYQIELTREHRELVTAKEHIDILTKILRDAEEKHTEERDAWDQEKRELMETVTALRQTQLGVQADPPRDKKQLWKQVNSIRMTPSNRDTHWKLKFANLDRDMRSVMAENARLRSIMSPLVHDNVFGNDDEKAILGAKRALEIASSQESQPSKRRSVDEAEGGSTPPSLGPPPPPPNFELARTNTLLDKPALPLKALKLQRKPILREDDDDDDLDDQLVFNGKEVKNSDVPHVSAALKTSRPNGPLAVMSANRLVRSNPYVNEFASPAGSHNQEDESTAEPAIPPRFSMVNSGIKSSLNPLAKSAVPVIVMASTARKPSNVALRARLAAADSPDVVVETPMPPARIRKQPTDAISVHSTPPEAKSCANVKNRENAKNQRSTSSGGAATRNRDDDKQSRILRETSSKSGNGTIPASPKKPQHPEMEWGQDMEDALKRMDRSKSIEIVELDKDDDQAELETVADDDDTDRGSDGESDSHKHIHASPYRDEYTYDARIVRVEDTFVDCVPFHGHAGEGTLDLVENTLMDDTAVLIEELRRDAHQHSLCPIVPEDTNRTVVSIDNHRSKDKELPPSTAFSRVKVSAGRNRNQNSSTNQMYSPRNRKSNKGVADAAGKPLEHGEYAFQEVVRKKEARGQMHAFDCECCKDYYEITKNIPRVATDGRAVDAIAHNSRHRSIYPPNPPTPPFLFDAEFPSSQEAKAQNKFSKRQASEWRGHLQDLNAMKQNPLK
ncbi:hypothetical protein SeMB42_g07376 [Synchytrium endobioticum]|uniref:DNA endonuclease activator Ctp1 C-terminal domain-containing protein n=1 Tax=Synchytrium endobioticum TaxID=286115 RepID=A0A507C9D4_9FUNG|nr:hypothetical protein SeMB42_g07376 [Synchytrium endobioticum]